MVYGGIFVQYTGGGGGGVVRAGPDLLALINFDPSLDKQTPAHGVWDEIIYSFTNGCSVEVWEWKSNFIPHLIMDVITHSC